MTNQKASTEADWHVDLAGYPRVKEGENTLLLVELKSDVPQEKLRRYEVTVKVTETDFKLTSIRVFADDVKLEHLRQVPLTELRAAAFEFVRRAEERLDDGEEIEDILADPYIESAQMMPGERVSVQEFKRAYRNAAADRGSSKREALAKQFHVSVYTIDKWVRHARDIGEIPKPQRNKPQTPTTEENE